MKNKYLILSLIMLLVVSLTGCSGINNNNNDDSKMIERVNSEIDYLDAQLLGMLNKLNNIYFQRYSVSAEKITSNSATGSDKEGEQSSSEPEGEGNSAGGAGSDSSTEGNSSGGSSGGGSSGQSEGASGEQSGSSGGTGNNSIEMKYTMKPNTILSRKDTIDWENFNMDIENLYDAWPAIMLDLYKKEVDNKLVTEFSSDLEIALNSIKNKDKNACLASLAKLYYYIPQFSSTVNGNNIKTNVLKTKSSLINAYSMVEIDKWQQIGEELINVEQNYIPILNDITSNKKKEYNINKAYILIKELQKNVADKNKDTFYINYKNLLQELEIVSQ